MADQNKPLGVAGIQYLIKLQKYYLQEMKDSVSGWSYSNPWYVYLITSFIGAGAAIWLQFTKFGFDPGVMFSSIGGGLTFVGITLLGVIIVDLVAMGLGMLISKIFDLGKNYQLKDTKINQFNSDMYLEILRNANSELKADKDDLKKKLEFYITVFDPANGTSGERNERIRNLTVGELENLLNDIAKFYTSPQSSSSAADASESEHDQLLDHNLHASVSQFTQQSPGSSVRIRSGVSFSDSSVKNDPSN